MPSITLKSHYDGRSLLLDEPYELPTNAQTLVTVVTPAPGVERKQWTSLGGEGIARAYGDNEPEYSLDDVRRPRARRCGAYATASVGRPDQNRYTAKAFRALTWCLHEKAG